MPLEDMLVFRRSAVNDYSNTDISLGLELISLGPELPESLGGYGGPWDG